MSTVTSRHRRSTSLTFNPGIPGETSVQVALRQLTEPARISLIIEQSGLTKVRAVFEGRLVEPLLAPPELKPGMVAYLDHANVRGVLRVEPYEDALPERLRRRFGQRLMFTWRTDEVP